MRKLILLLNLVPVLALANPPHAGGHPPHMPPMPEAMEEGGRLPPFLRDVDLTEQQRQAIQNLLTQQGAAIDDIRKQEHAIKKQLHQLSFSADYSDEKAAALIEQAQALHKKLALQQAKLDNAIFKLLSAEQQAALKKPAFGGKPF